VSWPLSYNEDYGWNEEFPEKLTCSNCKFTPVCVWAVLLDELCNSGAYETGRTTTCPFFEAKKKEAKQ
jgi:hypothetical protein